MFVPGYYVATFTPMAQTQKTPKNLRPGSLRATRATKRINGKKTKRRVRTAVRVVFANQPVVRTLEVFPAKGGKNYHWRAKAGNGEIVANGEGYKRKWAAHRGAKRTFPGVKIAFVAK